MFRKLLILALLLACAFVWARALRDEPEPKQLTPDEQMESVTNPKGKG